ncbi:MAG TPA: PDZ domain-containing protein [Lacipirellula sp.]
MKRDFLWTTAALAAALWISGPNVRATAQSVEGAADTATEAAADTGSTAGSASSTTDAAGSADASSATSSSTDAASSTGASTSATTGDTASSATNDASASTDAAASTTGQSDAQSSSQLDASSQPSTSGAASQGASVDASANVPATTDQSNVQAGASADLNADANLQTDATADQPQVQNQIQGSASTDAAAATDIDANLQRDADLRAGAQLNTQQNLQRGLEFGQATDRGLAISSIAQDHFFYDSGLRRGDVLVSYAGHPIHSHADFNRWVTYQPGQRVPVVVLRDGRPQTIYVVYEQQQGIQHQAGYAPSSGAYLGVTFDSQNPQQAVIRSVAPGSPAEQAGVQPGDVIVAINGNRVGGSQDVIRIVQSMQPGQAIDLAIARQVVLGQKPGVAQAGYAPNVRIQGSAATQVAPATPPVPAPTAEAATVEGGAYVGSTGAVDNDVIVPGSGRYDNTPARAGDTDRDGRLLDADGRVGPAEGRAILPRRRN